MNYQPRPQVKDTVTARLTTDEQSARRIADRFVEAFAASALAVGLADAGAGRWRLTLYLQPEVDEAEVRKLARSAAGPSAGKALLFDRLAAKDWVAETLLGLSPVTAGRFVIHGAHDRGRARGRIAIEIDAAQAFGTGHHGSTRGCLLALDSLCKVVGARRARLPPSLWKREGRGGGHRRRRLKATPTRRFAAADLSLSGGGKKFGILDLGTGSGILAIAAAKGLGRPVLASDIDPQAVRIAHDNTRLNASARLVRVGRAHGVAAEAVRAGAPFDLVFANILLASLQRLAVPLTGIIAPKGRLILSGLLNAQANAARAAYPQFTLERRIAVDGWTTLVLRRASTLPVRKR